ncbi:MAG: hypothetical protein AAFQ07_21275 [Chloroflexota bacterium]
MITLFLTDADGQTIDHAATQLLMAGKRVRFASTRNLKASDFDNITLIVQGNTKTLSGDMQRNLDSLAAEGVPVIAPDAIGTHIRA